MFAPEDNYYSMVCGAGPAPMLAYGDVLLAHHASMTAVVGVSSGTATTTAAAWQGLGGSAAQAALVEHNTEHLVLAEETLAKAQVAHLAAAAHSATVTRMVPAPPAHANRLEEAADELINPLVWGALTPRIADLNLEYFGFMWPNNAAAGVSYGVALDGFGAALMAPSLPAVSGGSPGAVAAAAASLAEGAGLSAGQAGLQAAESGAMEVLSPAGAAPAAALSAVTSVSSVSSVASAPAVQPLAAVQHTPSVPAQQLAPAQTSVGMFAQPPVASVMAPPVAPNPAAAESPAGQLLTPRPAPVAPPMPAAAPGVTSFVPPAQPFAPPPTAGRAAGLKPGMLNASALRGPVTTMPLTTTATSTLATATQPLAHVPPDPPRPIPPTPPQQPPLPNNGDIAHTLNPPPQPTQPTTPPPPAQLLTPPTPPHPASPAAPQSSPPAPSADDGGTGVQMLGTGPGGAPQAPPAPIPLDPEPTPPPPPPPVRGRPPEGLHPPVEGPLTPGPPSRAGERRRGAEHLWDDQGGEWRYHGEDKDHNPHWDYKPPGKNTRWDQIPIGDLPPLKGGVDSSLIAKLPPWMQNLLGPGVPGGPQNPLLAPYPGATMPAPPPAYVPPPDAGLFPPIDMPDLDPGSAMPIAGGEIVVIDGILVLLIAGVVICLA
jgi:PPE family